MDPHKLPWIAVGAPVFLSDGAGAFGAVRALGPGSNLRVSVEGGGDFFMPLEAVEKVAHDRVVVRWHLLPDGMQEAIRHATEAEDFPPPGEEVELVPPPGDEDDDESFAPGYEPHRHESPPGELPGRDCGALRSPTKSSRPPGRP